MKHLPFVNPLQGTDSSRHFSQGNTLPIVAMPYGMAHWILQTDEGPGWVFNPRSPKVRGFRLTHQPSPWMGDYGSLIVLPQVGRRFLSSARRATAWRLDRSSFKPNLMSIELAANGTKMALAPTTRGAVFQFDFAASPEKRIIFDGITEVSSFDVDEATHTISGFTTNNSGGVPDNFAAYFVAILDQPIRSWCRFKGDTEGDEGDGPRGLCVELGDVERVTMRVGTSFISVEQAHLNLQREIGDKDLERVASEAADVWEQELNLIEIETDDEAQRATFYTCFYRTKLFPRIWHELDAANEMVHFSPYDGNIHPGEMYADTGFWDTYRTLHPLLTLVDPAREAEILRGFVNAYHESGWLPQWPSPGHRVCMPGTHLDATIADAVVKGVIDFDISAALDAMLRHARGSAAEGPYGAGRSGIENYLSVGYVLGHQAVSQTLDYAYDDWSIAQTASALNRCEEAAEMIDRASGYGKLFDPEVGFMRPKNADGTWAEPFDEFAWGGPYCEGGPWQSSWAVQHDPAGLMALHGGEDKFAAKLDELLAKPPYFNVHGYSMEIHEMTEMAAVDFGQYAHSNQPVHHILYLYLAAGRAWRTQKEVRRVLDELYSADKFSGDEDNGEMAAWYVLSALGIFPHCPGRPEWALGSPLFTKATVHLGDRSLVIDAPANSSSAVYVDGVTVDGVAHDRLVIDHSALVGASQISFAMSKTPNMTVAPTPARLSSLSEYS